MTRDTSLPPQVIDVVLTLAVAMGDAGLPLASQVRLARMVTYSPTYIDVDFPSGCQRGGWPDGPLPIKPVVMGETDEPAAEILVWVSAGRLTMLEQAWFTDDPPRGWPLGVCIRVRADRMRGCADSGEQRM